MAQGEITFTLRYFELNESEKQKIQFNLIHGWEEGNAENGFFHS